ncbi:hypothetical protein NLG97_g7301 [Lecanicillium saksenae]|uniref:Uncharacterized protein n=1 Tax=Lecanicillium saksenae TaxID=468837 RepID=A0ACC1QP14_9HYPO|nr:hypothetical protein NLG97_g7301 [Lecanicillium saksenae]
MLPSLLKGSYREYKADTDVVAAWLATMAAENGYRSGGSSLPANQAPSSRRLKGKARKQAKAGVPVTSLPNTGPKTTHVVKIHEFEPLATFIAGLGTVTVPAYVAKTLSRVISVRKTFAQRLVSNGVEVTAKSESNHSFFVEVLEKVRKVLQPLMAADQYAGRAAGAETSKQKQPAAVVRNIFNSLEVYHTTVDFENAPDVAPLKPSAKVDYVSEQADSVLDILFAVTTLLSDYAELKKLARSLEEEIEPLLQKAGGGHPFLQTFFLSLCRGAGLDGMTKVQPMDAFNVEAYDVAEACLLNTLILLASYTAVADPEQASLQNYNGKFGWYDESLRGSEWTNRQKWMQDLTAVLELMPDLSFLVSRAARVSVTDELTRGLAYMINEQRPTAPLWVAFALQIYLMVLHEFGHTCDGFGIMQAESRRIKYSMLDVPPSSCSHVLKATSLWDKDPMAAARDAMMDTGLLPPTRSQPFKFLRRYPMYCGLLIHNMRATVQTEGLPYPATPGALVGVVQLHHALHQEGLLEQDCVWEDLQTLLELQGNASFFVGQPPTNKQAYFTNYCLSIGTSLTHWAAGQRKSSKTVKVHSDNRRHLESQYAGVVSKLY